MTDSTRTMQCEGCSGGGGGGGGIWKETCMGRWRGRERADGQLGERNLERQTMSMSMSMPKETFNSTPPPPQHQLAWKLHVQDTQCSVSALIFAESHARFLEGLRLFALLLPALLGPDSVNDFFFLPFVRAPVVVADGRRINAAPA